MLQRLRKVEPYWYIILVIALVTGGIYANHLNTHETPSRVAITLPLVDLPIYWYGVLIVGGIMLGAYTVTFEIRRRGLDPEHVWGGLTWALVLGVIGARLYHVLTPPPSMCRSLGICSALDYIKDPIRLIDFRGGGLGIYGAIVGGILGIYLYGRRYKMDWLAFTDVGSYGLALGQFVGRWGNFFNQELYGRPTDLPWAVYIEHPLPAYAEFQRFHPTFLYESLWNFLTFLVLFTIARRASDRLLKGELLGLYLIMYPIGRILMETIRLDSPNFFFNGQDSGINIAMALAGATIVLVAGALLARRRARAGEQAG
jgi:phosphatidylglycerol:prolipoprotein diacylglycerol transferase